MRCPPTIITMGSTPQPTGPYQVGIYKRYLFDKNRKEICYPDGRLIPIQIYFPIIEGKNSLHPKICEKYSPHVFSEIFYHVYGLETDISYLSNGKHPVIFLNHGLTAAMTDYSAITEDLASNGYVVIAIQHQLLTDADPVDEPPSWKDHSFSLQAKVIDNILFVFEWLQENESTIFNYKLDCKKIGFIGHSLGSNSLLLLSNRRSGLLEKQPIRTLLPHKNQQGIRECIITIDFDISFSYPRHNEYPMLFIFSEERRVFLEGSNIFNDIVNLGHTIKFYEHSKHISFFDQGYVDPRDTCFPKLYYFNGNNKKRKDFFDNFRYDIREFLKKQFCEDNF